MRGARVGRKTGERFSLSAGERAGVRGIEASASTGPRRGGLVPKGRHSTARGEALGFPARQILQPGKGETNAGSALTGLNKNRDAATQGLALGFRLTRFQR